MGTSYHQFCPVAKAMELLDERWTLLIVGELVAGDRFGRDRRVRRRSRPSGRGHRDRQPAARDRGLARRRELAGCPPLRRPRHPGPALAAPGPAALVHPVGLRPDRPAGLTPGLEVTGSMTRRTAMS